MFRLHLFDAYAVLKPKKQFSFILIFNSLENVFESDVIHNEQIDSKSKRGSRNKENNTLRITVTCPNQNSFLAQFSAINQK